MKTRSNEGRSENDGERREWTTMDYIDEGRSRRENVESIRGKETREKTKDRVRTRGGSLE